MKDELNSLPIGTHLMGVSDGVLGYKVITTWESPCQQE
jgi:hypothetical protein